jgi:arylsulfatase A
MAKIAAVVAALLISTLLGGRAARAADAAKANADVPAKPNVIFFLADDLGLDGVSCYGADKHKTPNVDALAASGMRFTTAYAAPLCGPSRCLLMTGRYAFRTGGITNGSWRGGGPGAKAADEQPIAKLMKQGGYATCQAGKWRQVGELPGDWGFDEFLTDRTAGGWYWETKYNKNGKEVELPPGTYSPDAYRDFALDFMHRNKEKPFFLYYASHLVHKPTFRTPDTKAGTGPADAAAGVGGKPSEAFYDDNIGYLDKELGVLVAELEKLGLRKNTLIVFAGDNGTAVGYPSPVGGRMINGAKASMLEGGSRVPFVASWPAVVKPGTVSDDIVSFADPYATFAQIAGVRPPDGFKTDGQSFLPQLKGEPGTPRKWAYVQLGAHWFVREPGYKMNERGELSDMADAPFVEKLVSVDADTDASKAARGRLSAALAELNPAGGKQDRDNAVAAKPRARAATRPAAAAAAAAAVPASPTVAGPWKSGDSLKGAGVPEIAGKAIDVTADVDAATGDGVIVAQGGRAEGYSVHVVKGKLAFAVREGRTLTEIVAKDPVPAGRFTMRATLAADGTMALAVDDKPVAAGKAAGPIPSQPRAGLTVGAAAKNSVTETELPATFAGKVTNVRVRAMPVKP